MMQFLLEERRQQRQQRRCQSGRRRLVAGLVLVLLVDPIVSFTQITPSVVRTKVTQQQQQLTHVGAQQQDERTSGLLLRMVMTHNTNDDATNNNNMNNKEESEKQVGVEYLTGDGGSDNNYQLVTVQEERILRQDADLWEEQAKAVCLPNKKKKEPNNAVIANNNKNSYNDALQEQRSRNLRVAIVSIVLAIGNFFWQYSHPVTEVQLLFAMQQSSVPMTLVGTNGKPSVVDFWAPWCENCKFAAPTLNKVEEEYRDRVNFVMVNGDLPQAWPYLEAFHVDAIPHLALVSADGVVETSLIGPTPKSVLEADLDVLIQNSRHPRGDGGDSKDIDVPKQPLPYVMLDVFANTPERRTVHFEE